MEDNNYADASMMIRKPVEQVFNAFIDPAVTSQFWFTKSSGKLELGKNIVWSWEMYGINVPVLVESITPNERIQILWGEGEQESRVKWEFKAIEASTFVQIKNYDFKSKGNQLINQIRDSTGGFTLVLAGLKAYLEHDIQLNLIDDKWPIEMR